MARSGLQGRGRRWSSLVVGLGLVSLALMGGCAGAPVMESSGEGSPAPGASPTGTSQEGIPAPMARMDGPSTEAIAPVPGTEVGQLTPQQVKRASLVITLTDLDGAMTQVQEVVRRAQGDLLSLEDTRQPEGRAHQVYLTLRVPQAQLEPTLTALRELGTVESQAIHAEDVSSQLVDLAARIKNLRQSEAALQRIMDRSGEISQVLEVARELSTVRDSIERLAAQEQNIQRQVAYSTIDLTLQSPITVVPPLRPASETLGNTWQGATQSVQAFTIGGLKVTLWLLAYSPYWILLSALVYGGYRLRRRRRPTDP